MCLHALIEQMVPTTPTPPHVRAMACEFDISGDYDVEMSSTVWLSREHDNFIHW